MTRHHRQLATALAILAFMGAQAAHAADAPATGTRATERPIYGSQMMTDKERTTYRAKMWAAQSDEERDRIRAEHHAEMKQRAQAQGRAMPDEPPARRGMRAGRQQMWNAPCDAASGVPAASAPCDDSRPRHMRRYQRGSGPMAPKP